MSRLVKYIPEEKSGFTGYVEIRMPKYKERLGLIKGLDLKTDSKGEVELGSDTMDKAIKFAEIAESHVESVKLQHPKVDSEITSLDDLDMYEEGTMILQKITGVILNGVKLGND